MSETIIEVSDLSFTYAGATSPAVRGAGFAVSTGEILGFLGPNGAGKSTTQKILIGLLKEFTGNARVMGRDLRTLGQRYYEDIGVGFELPNHYLKLTAKENLEFFRSLYDGETEDPQALLDMVDLADDGDTRVGAYSKGMRMRLNFARALLNKPKLLFLDEPTSGLDPVSARRIKDIILEQKRAGRTVFLTTHNMADADELCDRVAFIVDGAIKAIDAPRDLKLQHGERKVKVEFRDNGQLASEEFSMDGLGENAAFADVLRTREIETIHTLETTLEHVFIDLTGQRLQ